MCERCVRDGWVGCQCAAGCNETIDRGGTVGALLITPEQEKLRPCAITFDVVKLNESSVEPSSSIVAGLWEMELFEDPWLDVELCTDSFLCMCP